MAGESGVYLLQQWEMKCNDKNTNGKIRFFIYPGKTNNITGNSEATQLPPIGKFFMDIQTSGSNSVDEIVLVSLQKLEILQYTIDSFFYNRFATSKQIH